MRRFIVSTVIATVMLIAGCASNKLTGDTYTREDARKVHAVTYGRVLSVKSVVIEGNREGIVGNLGGAVVGGLAGSSVGGGTGQSIATVVGTAVGGIVGQAVEEKLTRKQGQEITLETDSGQVLSVVQELADQKFFKVGERVRLLQLGETVRVSY